MEAILEIEKTTDIAFILKKITNTVDLNSDRTPELMYVTSGLATLKEQHGNQESLETLTALSNYIREKLWEYYLVRNLHHQLQQDLDRVKAGIPLNQEEEFYL
ncbi:MAG: hypothetical protein ACO1OF_19895 [Adhaeribacter sp.]